MKVGGVRCFVFLICFSCLNLIGQSGSTMQPSGEASFARLPFIFEANRGQAEKAVEFLARGADYTVLLESEKTEIVLPPPRPGNGMDEAGSPSLVTIEFVGANRNAQFEAGQLLPGKSNYILGKESSRWLVDIPQYGRVTQKSVYRGIDLVYYGNEGNLEYDFVIAPGSHPQSLAFRVQGAQGIEVSDSGDLLLRTPLGDVRLQKPAIYQQKGRSRRNIDGKFVLRSANEIGVTVGDYDVHSPLIVDPVLSFSTLIGTKTIPKFRELQWIPAKTCLSPEPLVAGAHCSISVFFNPALQGMLVGSLSIQDDGLNGQHTIALSGTGH